MAENKATTLEQLRALAERGKLDTLNRVDQLLEVDHSSAGGRTA